MSHVAAAIRSVRIQWDEAPWFVLFMVGVFALIALIATSGILNLV